MLDNAKQFISRFKTWWHLRTALLLFAIIFPIGYVIVIGIEQSLSFNEMMSEFWYMFVPPIAILIYFVFRDMGGQDGES